MSIDSNLSVIVLSEPCKNVPACRNTNANTIARKGNDSLEIRRCHRNAPVMDGLLKAQKFTQNFSDEEVEMYNRERKLPDGYLLKYIPESTKEQYHNGVYVYDKVVPAKYNLVNLARYSDVLIASHITSEIPEGLKLVNLDKGTYIVSEYESTEALNKRVNGANIGVSAGSKVFGVGFMALALLAGIRIKNRNV